MECVHIKVTGSGSASLPANGVSFPGAYKATDAGILFNIYSGFTSYPIPGPKLWNGASAAAAATTPAAVTSKAAASTPTAAAPTSTTLATVTKPTATPVAGSGSDSVATAQKWAQCGGKGYAGATACASGSKCTFQNDYYSQCL